MAWRKKMKPPRKETGDTAEGTTRDNIPGPEAKTKSRTTPPSATNNDAPDATKDPENHEGNEVTSSLGDNNYH
eukprot:12911570-Prorocentrum_lima.AAC.1